MKRTNTPRRFYSLLWVEEKILEADYFARRLRSLHSEEFRYELSAFLSAARSITFWLQREMKSVPGFKNWWANRQQEMKADAAMTFFLELRNFSQKEGPVSMAGTGTLDCQGHLVWSYRFAGTEHRVPQQLIHRDIVTCCREHLSKLAALVLTFADAFPCYCCPRRAVTPEGLETYGFEITDVAVMLGFPPEWFNVAGIPQKEVFRMLQEQFDGVDFEQIRSIADYKPDDPETMDTPSNCSCNSR